MTSEIPASPSDRLVVPGTVGNDQGRGGFTAQREEGGAFTGTAAASSASVDVSKPPLENGGPRNNLLLMGVLLAALVLYAPVVFGTCFNFDVWYMLATGREIVEHGIPYQNPFSVQEGLGIIVQQWALCVLVYGIYSATGFVGLALWSTLMAAMLALSLYRLGRLLKGDRFGGEWLLLLLLVAFPAFIPYITMCSSVYSMIAYCWVVFFCEKYRRTGRVGWLVALPLLAVAHGGFHLSLAVFDLVIIGCYLVPDLLRPLHRRGLLSGVALERAAYRRLPLLGALAATALALTVNPYGLRGALYLFLSYGAADYGGAVPEMRAFAPLEFGVFGISMLAMVALALLVVGRKGPRAVNLPLVLLFVGTAFLAFDHVRNMWLATPFSYALVAGAMSGWAMDPSWLRRPIPRRAAAAVAALLCAAATAFSATSIAEKAPAMADMEKSGSYSPEALVDYIERDAGTKDVRLFNPVRLGGYLEWRGLPVFVDSRLEIWNAPINGTERDHYREYVDMSSGKWSVSDFERFLAENDFDYLVTDQGSYLDQYLDQTEVYQSVMGTGSYTLWKRR